MTNCLEMAPLLALAPDELPEPQRALLTHLEACPDCRARQALFAGIRAATTRTATQHAAPAALRARLAAALHAEEAPAPPPLRAMAARLPASRGWLALASGWFAAGALASALYGVLALGPVLRMAPAALPDLALPGSADVYIDNHARALVTDHLIDVASSDRHTVKPWFRGRIDFSPPVVDLAGQGFPLLGGRLDYVEQRNVAVLVYGRRQHVIDVYIWADGRAQSSAALAPAGAEDVRGYRLVRGSAAGTRFVVVSDLDSVELRGFTGAFGEALASGKHVRQ
jgi:anti-sigma factor RsiW